MLSVTIPPHIETGLAEIDRQHAELIALTNAVLANGALPADQQPMLRDLADLARYVEFHFATEESLMRLHRYIGTRHHIEDHERLRRSLVEILDLSKLPDSTQPVLVRLRLLVEQSFVKHIQMLDVDLAELVLRATPSTQVRAPLLAPGPHRAPAGAA